MQWPDIRWREYEEALDEARRQRKPVLLSLSSAWCSDAALGDPLSSVASAPALSGQRSLADVSRQFVFARVDVERRPDLERRFDPVELPAVLLLGPDGNVLLGSGAGSPAGAQPALASRSAPAADLRTALTAVEGMLLLSFDEVHGGFGVAPKRPEGYALTYAVDRHQASSSQRWQEIFSLTLDGITRGLFDTGAGGFYRSAEWRDWQMASPAKLLGVNAEVIRAYFRAYEATRRTGYLDVASRSLQFVLATLRGPAFYGSVTPDGRLDRTIYLPANEEMVGTLLLAARVTGDGAYVQHARQVQRFLLERLYDADLGFAHYYDHGDGAAHLYGLLLDNAAGLVGLARSYAALDEPDYLAAARRTAERIVDGFPTAVTGRPCASGPARASPTPLRPALARGPRADSTRWDADGIAFEDGTLAAEGLLALGKLIGSAEYCRVARQIAGALSGSLAGHRPGVLARYGSVVQSLLEVEAGLAQSAAASGPGQPERGAA